MSRMFLPKVILFQFSTNVFMLPASKLSTLFIGVRVTFNFKCITLTWFSNFCAGASVRVLVPVAVLLEEGFCWNNSSQEVLDVFWVFLVSAKVGTESFVISTVIWCDISFASFVTGLSVLYSLLKYFVIPSCLCCNNSWLLWLSTASASDTSFLILFMSIILFITTTATTVEDAIKYPNNWVSIFR